MREGLFIKKHIEKWKEYQYGKSADPDEMAEEFTELVNDLGYARTFYPHSKVTQYLNGLASRIYLSIYRNKKEPGSCIWRFWKTELPLTVRRRHREILTAFSIFFLFCVLAAFSAAHDQSFVRGVLGDGYVEMTQDNISKGDPFGVYKNDTELNMFFTIALNNLYVSYRVFVLGFFLGLGSIKELFVNGIMVGAFQYFFFDQGLGWASVLVIWIHGTLEISSIILAGASGIIIGRSILFPGTQKRLKSLREGGRDGVKIMFGITPVILAAAFLEGFVTRHTGMPLPLSLAILLGSLFFVVWYFVVYPIRLERRMNRQKTEGAGI